MRTLWLSLLALLLGGTALAAPRPQVHVNADFDPAGFVISGTVEVRVAEDSFPLDDLRFLLYPNLFCDTPATAGIVVDSIHVNGVDLTARMTIDTTDLHVDFPPDLPRVDTTVALLWFRSHIPKEASVYGYDDNQFLLVAWYPAPAPLRDGHWLRHHYQWFLEPASDPLDVSAVVRYPDSLQLIAGGIQQIDTLGGTATAVLKLEHSVGLPLFFGTDYEVNHFDLDGMDLSIHARPEQAYVVDSLRRVAAATVRWMSDYVLPYPYDELIIVVGGYTEGGALEEPHMVLMPRHGPAVTNYYQETLIHELVHQWFYATICNNTATDPWMDEAVTEYFAMKINRELVGQRADLVDIFGLTASSALEARLGGYDFLSYLPLTYSGERYYNTRQCYANIYDKGPQVIQTLTALMGPENERGFWQAYARTYEFDVPTPEDFAVLADEYLPAAPGSARRILDCVNAVDYQIMSLENKPVEPRIDRTSQADSTGDSAAAEPLYDIEVVYRCVQPLGLPVGLRVTFYDDSVADTVVAGEVGTFTWKLTRSNPARSAAIDPDYKYAVDVNYLNNSLTLDESRGAGLRLFSGLVFLVESLFSGLWGF